MLIIQITAILLFHKNRAVSTEAQQRAAKLHFPTTTEGIQVYYSARTFKRPTHCLTTTFTSRIPGQRRLDLYFCLAKSFRLGIKKNTFCKSIIRAGNLRARLQRAAYWRWAGFLALNFNRRPKVEFSTSVDTKPFSPPIANTMLAVRLYCCQ